MHQILITNPYLLFVQMDLQNTSVTVQLGRGASIQLANAIINTGATIQFGGLQFSATTARSVIVHVYIMNSEAPARRPHSTETTVRRMYFPAFELLLPKILPSLEDSIF
ncbi:hypothetical protein MA16_Dca009960 [Dendrobium catenatum]|uniref:Uncharacterized protein n=1 Tax=Dendrobium catenatum TaxID=906689 RepID=A0A2I0WDC3_9ASPA|nr:hypothetical protein MA16_Dca009960 [Dendrobium catenatum]